MNPHTHPIRVYYEDTDLAGIVYYANYLKFIERGRSEWIASLGVDQAQMFANQGVVFAVRRIEADYLRPARFGEDLQVMTEVTGLTGARIMLEQSVLRDGAMLFRCAVVLICLNVGGTAVRVPEIVRRALSGAVH
jgi:acyl-CoA thioester hydrolase